MADCFGEADIDHIVSDHTEADPALHSIITSITAFGWGTFAAFHPSPFGGGICFLGPDTDDLCICSFTWLADLDGCRDAGCNRTICRWLRTAGVARPECRFRG
jgi:hypothetical protein